LSVSDDDILLAIKTAGPMTTSALQAHLGISRQGTRQRLAALAEGGLLKEERQQASVGRPPALWSLTATGHARFPDGHAELSAQLLDDVRELFGTAGLERLIRRREGAQATRYRAALADCRSLEERLERLALLRSAEGYMASVTREADGSFRLSEHHCPICAAATACRGFCRAELDLFRSLLAPEASVERLEHLLAEGQRCVYRVAPLR